MYDLCIFQFGTILYVYTYIVYDKIKIMPMNVNQNDIIRQKVFQII